MLAKETFDFAARTYRQLLPVPLSVASGELLYSIREANPENCNFSSPDISQPVVVFDLEKRLINGISPGASGRIVLWARGGQTFCEISKPVRNPKRYAVWYLLMSRRQTMNMQVATEFHGAWFSLTGEIMDYILDHDLSDELFFQNDDAVAEHIFPYATAAIQNILLQALGISLVDTTDENIKILMAFILDAIRKINRQSVSSFYSFSELMRLQSILQRIDIFGAKEETDDLTLLASLTPDVKRKYGFDRIYELVERCVDVTYDEQLGFHEKVIALFFNRVYKSAPIPAALSTPPYQKIPPLERLSLSSDDLTIMEMRRNGNTASETGFHIGKAEKTVYNKLNTLRKQVIEEYGKEYADIVIPSRRRSKKRIGESP